LPRDSRPLVPKTTREEREYFDASGATDVYAPGPGVIILSVSSFRPQKDHFGAVLTVESVVKRWLFPPAVILCVAEDYRAQKA